MLGNAIWFLIIGAIAGWAAGKLTRGQGFGLWVDMILGIVGAYIGGFALSMLGFAAYGTIGQLITSIIGAVLVLWISRLFVDTTKKT
ncbi:MAG TPA: GlsB/YeaQ/YmgE family stress response membrane protein [Methylomusa anaerophila]|uniref:Transglycosylase associated protein n=1 Tax=Methylomusa anaerophila TaxID=1930071 RepID=A0A348AHT0_9FIRM|nr:GlsB/YeaQ/YmgE family stress response membrane protein [Methylomusa anaerophila]BBB90628.1 transglycosylase associated protein [Methylomusa anaerophila]HML88765.1 GlsB/YeaQ/YmgE family stress response membrane protein [Methylomusa anaerophila]